MKNKKDAYLQQKAVIEKKLIPWFSLKQDRSPESGWIKAIRNSMGMTTQQLADKMGIAQPNVMAIEEREARKAITLETLEKAAQAMDCQLVYALVPNQKITDATELKTPASIPQSINEEIDWVTQLQKNLRNPR